MRVVEGKAMAATAKRLGDVIGDLRFGAAPAARPITNPIGLAVWCVRNGKVEQSERGLIFALSCARRAQRVGRSPWTLFWWLVRNPTKLWAGDDEWPGVKELLDRAGRTLTALFSLAIRRPPAQREPKPPRAAPATRKAEPPKREPPPRTEPEPVDRGWMGKLVAAMARSRRVAEQIASALRMVGFDVRAAPTS